MAKLPITDTCVIYQFQRSGDKEGYSVDPVYQNVNVSISPTGTDIATGFGDVPSFQVFEAFFMDVTLSLHNGDKIKTSNNQEYLIDGMPFVVNNQYMQYIRCLVKQVV